MSECSANTNYVYINVCLCVCSISSVRRKNNEMPLASSFQCAFTVTVTVPATHNVWPNWVISSITECASNKLSSASMKMIFLLALFMCTAQAFYKWVIRFDSHRYSNLYFPHFVYFKCRSNSFHWFWHCCSFVPSYIVHRSSCASAPVVFSRDARSRGCFRFFSLLSLSAFFLFINYGAVIVL